MLILNEFKVLLTAALPIVEVKGAIPVGIALGMSPIHATILAFLGSILPVPIILFTIRPIFNYLKETVTFKKIIHKLIHRSLNKSGNVKKYGYWGLFIFVAIPLPGTGVWTGSLIASLLDLRFKYAFPTIVIGNLVASIFIMTLSFGAVSIFGG
ncbi:small multi-drug export protein [Sedimentibacter hydroxybenzoicus DSM 7310]|uniref:Small multi-drug export protein n=1 Tax=Sedimentibacter hydroxybenzoicus DSM 7310 TaxID=1123245 RepID=A0A974GWX4_SEDHY|nr:small multi-drug export protein [Sedimentibacter hydroxybenzoicus]NYB74500.1 small multi-drug export protein [Sedimentibacter hydroxybenzoicus DSM 7310]HCX63330.1 ligand-binding protein SH3 [Clostridiales bacterium]